MDNTIASFETSITFGQIVKEARIRLGITQKELAEKCGVDPVYISQIEKGLRNIPSFKLCGKMSLALNISDELVKLAVLFKLPPEFRYLLKTDKKDVLSPIFDNPAIRTEILQLKNTHKFSDLEIVSLLKGHLELIRETHDILHKYLKTNKTNPAPT